MCWHAGVLACQCAGVLVCQCVGVLACWSAGMPMCWCVSVPVCWCVVPRGGHSLECTLFSSWMLWTMTGCLKRITIGSTPRTPSANRMRPPLRSIFTRWDGSNTAAGSHRCGTHTHARTHTRTHTHTHTHRRTCTHLHLPNSDRFCISSLPLTLKRCQM